MLVISKGKTKFNIKINGYEPKEKRYNGDDDSWCNLFISIKNEYINFETNYSMLESCEVDIIYKMLEELLNGTTKKVSKYTPLEPAFRLVCHPKGVDYGLYYEDAYHKKLKENDVELEMKIILTYQDGYANDEMIDLLLDRNEIVLFKNFLQSVILNREWLKILTYEEKFLNIANYHINILLNKQLKKHSPC